MTKNELVNIDIIKSADGKVCVSINSRRVAGCKPSLTRNNILYTLIAKKADIIEALGLTNENDAVEI